MGYVINDMCVLCGACVPACPEGIVYELECQYVIDLARCTECDDCLPVCPTNAIVPTTAEGGPLDAARGGIPL